MNAPRPAFLSFLRSLIVALMCGGAVASVQADPVVSNLTAAQRAGTNLVDITYDLDAARFSRATWGIPVTGATEGIGANACPVTGRAIACKNTIGRPRSFSTHMRLQVKNRCGITPLESFAASDYRRSEPGAQQQLPEYQSRDTRAPFLRKLT